MADLLRRSQGRSGCAKAREEKGDEPDVGEGAGKSGGGVLLDEALVRTAEDTLPRGGGGAPAGVPVGAGAQPQENGEAYRSGGTGVSGVRKKTAPRGAPAGARGRRFPTRRHRKGAKNRCVLPTSRSEVFFGGFYSLFYFLNSFVNLNSPFLKTCKENFSFFFIKGFCGEYSILLQLATHHH